MSPQRLTDDLRDRDTLILSAALETFFEFRAQPHSPQWHGVDDRSIDYEPNVTAQLLSDPAACFRWR